MREEGPIDDLDKIRLGREAGGLIEHAMRSVSKRNADIRKRIYKDLRKGLSLTAAAAIQAWIEMYEGEALIAFMQNEVESGKQAGERLKPKLDESHTKTPE